MAVILNIDTSTNVCSVALTADGFILTHSEEFTSNSHAQTLSSFIESCLDYLKNHDGMKLDAVAVALGPGSYTGLRIGLSEAKGLAYGLNIPLIGINTLEILAVGAMFAQPDYDADNDLIITMIDARRQEVYTATFDSNLREIDKSRPLILEPDSFQRYNTTGKRLIIAGNGAAKAAEILEVSNALFMPEQAPLAVNMLAIADKKYMAHDFVDTAYCTPLYLKDFQATTPRKRV